MFRLHDQSRRRVVRIAFCMLCLVPTAATAAWSALCLWPGRDARLLAEFSRALDCRLAAGRIEHLRPGAWRLRDVVLSDLADGQSLAQCAELELERQGGAWLLRIDRAVVGAQGMRWGWDQARRALAGRLALGERWRWRCGSLTVEATPGRDVPLADVEGGLEATPDKSHAFVTFRPAGASGEAARMWAVRSTSAAHEPIRLVLLSGEQPLPCAVAAPLVPAVAALGPEATFRGQLLAALSEEPVVEARPAEFHGLDLSRLMSAGFPHLVWRGKADLRCERAWTRGGRLEQVDGGRLSGGSGVIGNSLLRAAAEHLRLTLASRAEIERDERPYVAFACRFALQPGGVLLQGDSLAFDADTLLADEHGPLLRASGQPQPLAALVRTLGGPASQEVPLSPAAAALLARLPLPALAPWRGGAAAESPDIPEKNASPHAP